MFVLGTAGHVDHGKSTLITRLTGIDPDRLAEEKARGLTIDLGFAWFTLPSGREVGVVDVPGHERFVHNMLAGAGQVDAVLFVVDANEGWRPQSEEHLAILDLLAVRSGVVALTKIDVARDRPDVSEHLRGTVLEDAEVVPVSAVTGSGIDDLIAAIDRALDRAGEPAETSRPRVFVDRSFSIKGAGTVVTGTLTGGSLAEGDEVVVLPAGTPARVRGIQTHRAARSEAHATSRVALNLAGLERHEIRRGDAVVTPGRWRPTRTIDAWLRPVRALDHPLKPRGAYTLHAGTAEVAVRLHLLDVPELAPGTEGGYVRLALSEDVVAGSGDRFVVRDTGRRATVGGGVVLDAHPPPGRASSARAAELAVRRSLLPGPLADQVVAERGVVAIADLAWLAGPEPRTAHRLPSYATSEAWMTEHAGAIRDELGTFHAERPLERGMPREALRSRIGVEDARLFAELLDAVDGVVSDGSLVALGSHRVTVAPDKRDGIAAELAAAGFSPPSLRDLESRYGTAVVKALIESGELVRLAPDIAFGRERLEEAKSAIAATVEREGPLTASRIREVLGSSRKYVIPLLEHLDATGYTKRTGDTRTVR